MRYPYQQQRWAFGHICESSYGQGLAQASLDQCIKLQNILFAAEPANQWDDSQIAGKPHSCVSELENLEWRSSGLISGVADAGLLGLLLKMAMGKCSTTNYQHTFTMLSLDESFQKPTSAFAFRNDDTFRLFPGMQVTRLNLSGGKDQYVNFSATLSGDGRAIQMTGYTPPEARETSRFRDVFSSLYIGGENVSAKLRSWSIDISTTLIDFREFAQDQFALLVPANEAAGYYLLSHEWADHQVSIDLTLDLEDWQPWENMRDVVADSLVINLESELENSRSVLDTLQIASTGTYFKTVSQQRDKSSLTWQITGQPKITNLSSDFVVTLGNDISSY